MEKLNMANVNTLIKKGYLLAGVLMAANIFVVNEMKATENDKDDLTTLNQPQNVEGEGKEEEVVPVENGEKKSGEQGFFNFVLTYENTINLIGGLALSGANNYFKWWDYSPGVYRKLGCIGWRSKRLLNDIFQFEINLNGIRGISWSIPHIINLIMTKGSKKGKKDGDFSWITFFFKDILRGFTSMPLTFHFSNFSISISLDSIIWGIVGMILEAKDKKEQKPNKENQINNIENNIGIKTNKEKIDLNNQLNLFENLNIKEELIKSKELTQPIVTKEKQKKEGDKKDPNIKDTTGDDTNPQVNDETVNKENTKTK